MKTQERYLVGALLIVFCLLIVVVYTARAQSGGGYDLTWNTIDAGGGTSVGVGSSTPYILGGTIGQPDAGLLTGGGYTLVGGFWGGAATQYNIYLPVVLRS